MFQLSTVFQGIVSDPAKLEYRTGNCPGMVITQEHFTAPTPTPASKTLKACRNVIEAFG